MNRLDEIMRLVEEVCIIPMLNGNGEETGFGKKEPVTIEPRILKQMVELIRLQHEALKNSGGYCSCEGRKLATDALAAFDKFERGE